MSEPRIAALPAGLLPPEIVRLLPDIPDPQQRSGINLLRTLAQHPGLAVAHYPLSIFLLFEGEVPPRDRELAILRTAALTGADYIWGHHSRIGRDSGLTDHDFTALISGPDDPHWSPFESSLIRAADQIHHDNSIDKEAWNALGKRYSNQQLIELLFVVGHYQLISYVTNSIGITLDPGLPFLPT
ncbi:carboxymuconolactone decarboxylase family protein [Streptomyces noursei]|uniref:carboxymuconolactone decarboxylase family protein n=1 Tax=Streptomyces noursei TaxID=1971 RepID=UPI0019635D78|nr:carboxymuconolactone decarboxylase family protein [Streptomyces noursei]QRX89679.1 carboxymuconolactone decarboxylase family protein [Streptomyces noursei]